MGTTRKPVHLVKPNANREFVWAEIRARKIFTITDLTSKCTLKQDTIGEYVRALEKAGYIVKCQKREQANRPNTYRLVKDVVGAPRIRKNGTEVLQGRKRENLWRSMRILRAFKVADLLATAVTDEIKISSETAQEYCRRLSKAGYLVKMGDFYKLNPAMVKGPKPPMIQRDKSVFDPNINKIVWPVNKDE